jgi:hypothetical protein
MFGITSPMQCFAVAAVFITSIVLPFLETDAQTGGTAEIKGLNVTVLLFSGRPDPAYTINDKPSLDQVKRILEMSKETKFDKATVIPSILGYKGIVVENKANISGIPSGIPQRFAVYKGTIEVGMEGKRFLTDEGNTLEKFLLDKAIERGVIEEKILRRMKLSGR